MKGKGMMYIFRLTKGSQCCVMITARDPGFQATQGMPSTTRSRAKKKKRKYIYTIWIIGSGNVWNSNLPSVPHCHALVCRGRGRRAVAGYFERAVVLLGQSTIRHGVGLCRSAAMHAVGHSICVPVFERNTGIGFHLSGRRKLYVTYPSSQRLQDAANPQIPHQKHKKNPSLYTDSPCTLPSRYLPPSCPSSCRP